MKALFPLADEDDLRETGLSASKVQHELACMGFANVLDYVNIDELTGQVRPKELGELTRQQAAAIQEYEMAPLEGNDGEVRMVLSKLKLFDKRSALVDLGKSLGMFNEKMQMIFRNQTEEREKRISLEDIPTTDLEQMEKILMRASKLAKDERDGRHNIEDAEYKVLPKRDP